jgi:hypothetical protein
VTNPGGGKAGHRTITDDVRFWGTRSRLHFGLSSLIGFFRKSCARTTTDTHLLLYRINGLLVTPLFNPRGRKCRVVPYLSLPRPGYQVSHCQLTYTTADSFPGCHLSVLSDVSSTLSLTLSHALSARGVRETPTSTTPYSHTLRGTADTGVCGVVSGMWGV